METNVFKIMLIVLLLVAGACSCQKWVDKQLEKKYEPDCAAGNCITANIRGSLHVKPSGEGLKKIPVTIYFRSTMYMLPAQKKVASGKTNSNGEFDFSVTIDTTSFEDHRLIVEIPGQKNYFAMPTIGNSHEKYQRIFSDYNEDVLKNINFVFYRKATLTINFKRTQVDDFDSFYFDYSFDGNSGFSAISEESLKHKNKFQIETAADVYTKMRWWKRLNGEIFFETVDSLFCGKNSKNEFSINY